MTADTACPVCGQENAPDTGGCRCYGTPEPAYPTSADLRAFRYRIMPDAYDCEAFDRPTVRDWERGGIPGWHTPEGRDALARREASAMRSRDYADLARTATRNIEAPGHPDPTYAHPALASESGIGQRYHVAAWWTERQHGCPTWLPEDETR